MTNYSLLKLLLEQSHPKVTKTTLDEQSKKQYCSRKYVLHDDDRNFVSVLLLLF